MCKADKSALKEAEKASERQGATVMQHKSEYRRDSPERGNGQQCKILQRNWE